MSVTQIGLPVLRPGDSVTIPFVSTGGYVTSGGMDFVATVPMPYLFAGKLAARGSLIVRQGGKYLVGASGGGTSVEFVTAESSPGILVLHYNAKSSPNGTQNNAPVGFTILNMTVSAS